MISPEQSGDIKKNYCGHKIELFLDNLGNQELDNLRDHKHHLDSFLCNPANRMKYLLYCLGHEYDHSNTENLEVELLCVEDFSVGKRGSLLLLVT